VFHIFKAGVMIKGYDCGRQIPLVSLVYGIRDEMEVAVNSYVGDAIILVPGNESWEQ
jgi:hypothetical protein